MVKISSRVFENSLSFLISLKSSVNPLFAKGSLYSLCIRPGLGAITYNLSPSNNASSTEWVIKIIVFPVSFQIFNTQDCIFSRVNASNAPSGSSIKIKSGSLIKHLARAILCCIPPDN